LRELYEGTHRLGSRDRQVQLLRAASNVVPNLYKAQKWFHVRGDMEYASVYILHCVTSLAQVEVFLDSQLAGREVIQQAIELNPKFFKAIYTDLINAKKTKPSIASALDAIDSYLTRKQRLLFEPVYEYLKDAGSPRAAAEIETYFK